MNLTARTTPHSVDSAQLAALAPLTRGLQQLVERHGLDQDLLGRYHDSIEHYFESAGSQDSPEKENSPSSQPWGWQPALEGPELSMGTLTVFQHEDIPLHDHPGSIGLLIVLQGKVKVCSYRLAEEPGQYQPSPLELEQTGAVELVPGEYVHFGPGENNIHSLQAIDGDCVLFDILFYPYQLQQRSFYMPVTPQTSTGSVYVSRLNKFFAN